MHWWWKEELNERNWCIWCNKYIDEALMAHWGCIDKCSNECIDDTLMLRWWCVARCIDDALMNALMDALMNALMNSLIVHWWNIWSNTVSKRPVRLLILASLIVPAWQQGIIKTTNPWLCWSKITVVNCKCRSNCNLEFMNQYSFIERNTL